MIWAVFWLIVGGFVNDNWNNKILLYFWSWWKAKVLLIVAEYFVWDVYFCLDFWFGLDEIFWGVGIIMFLQDFLLYFVVSQYFISWLMWLIVYVFCGWFKMSLLNFLRAIRINKSRTTWMGSGLWMIIGHILCLFVKSNLLISPRTRIREADHILSWILRIRFKLHWKVAKQAWIISLKNVFAKDFIIFRRMIIFNLSKMAFLLFQIFIT